VIQFLIYLGVFFTYISIGAVYTGATETREDDNTMRFFCTVAWPIALFFTFTFSVWSRAYTLGTRYNRELRIELNRAAVEQLTKNIERLEREEGIGQEPPVHSERHEYRTTDRRSWPRAGNDERLITCHVNQQHGKWLDHCKICEIDGIQSQLSRINAAYNAFVTKRHR